MQIIGFFVFMLMLFSFQCGDSFSLLVQPKKSCVLKEECKTKAPTWMDEKFIKSNKQLQNVHKQKRLIKFNLMSFGGGITVILNYFMKNVISIARFISTLSIYFEFPFFVLEESSFQTAKSLNVSQKSNKYIVDEVVMMSDDDSRNNDGECGNLSNPANQYPTGVFSDTHSVGVGDLNEVHWISRGIYCVLSMVVIMAHYCYYSVAVKRYVMNCCPTPIKTIT
jgi:hypothetical protein